MSKRRTGSPPRAWGQQKRRIAARRAARFTPTGVGTTACPRRSVSVFSVHPHGRGDNLRLALDRAQSQGSPPRAWGQHTLCKCEGWSPRFTPTGVGTTEFEGHPCLQYPVHPHGRGDNRGADNNNRVIIGSPPRAWGQRRCTCSLRSTIMVHPHGRGDNGWGTWVSGRLQGSPPRAWGQLFLLM